MRFSVRDLLWLTLVIAVTLGWFVRERQLQTRLRTIRNHYDTWRGATGALEFAFNELGYGVEWDTELEGVTIHGLGPKRSVTTPLSLSLWSWGSSLNSGAIQSYDRPLPAPGLPQ